MPIMEFKCVSCGHEFEFIKIRSDDTVECPNCKERDEKKLERDPVPKGTSFQLRGGGWYKDRYGR